MLYAGLLEMQQELLMGILMQIISLKISCAPHHSFIQPVISLNELNSRVWAGGFLKVFFAKHYSIFSIKVS